MNIASRIPNEVLGEIFLHAIDGPISNIQDNSFPWAFETVCKSWRSAFVTSPHLWTWITINLSESYDQDLNAVNQGLSLCLERSRNYPLNISLHLPIEGDEDDETALVWQTFLSCSHRWQIVYLANLLEPEFFTLNSYTGAIPILESLTIHGPTDIGYNESTAFQIAPHLTRFTLWNSAAMFAIENWTIPWMQLTNLVLTFGEDAGVDQLSVLFKQLQDIEELRLIFEGEDQSIDLDEFVNNSGTPHCLQHLRVLQVCCIEFLDLITAPSLSELYLEGSYFFYPLARQGDPEVEAEEIVRSFIQRSSCKIHKLALSKFSQLLSTPLVELFSDVVELCLADASECLKHLLLPNQFPALRVLDCTAHTTDAMDLMGTLLEIFRLRNSSSAERSAAPLTKIILRPVLKDVPVATADWASFWSFVQVGSCREPNLTRHP